MKEKRISYLAVGKDRIDLPKAMQLLSEHFSIKRLAVCGGGHINGSFLREGLLDAISMQIAPGIDGRDGMTASFDGAEKLAEPILLKLQSVECMGDTIWAIYSIKTMFKE